MKKLLEKFFTAYKQEFILVFIALLIAIVSVPLFTYWYFAKALVSKDAIMNGNDTGVVLLDRNDKPFFTFYEAKARRFVPLQDIPIAVQHAVIASEDRDFYHHPGFSIPAILRSMMLDIEQKDVSYGGSTITQQLVKNVLLTPQKSFIRKYQEVVLAQEIERRYSKNEILEMYLNSVYFGEGAFGVESAARVYFGESVRQLTPAQATILAAVLPSPSRYSPLHGDKEALQERQLEVLRRMELAGYITEQQKHKILQTKLTYARTADDLNAVAPHFALMVRDELIKRFGEERISRSGFRVKTTIDLADQKYAEDAVEEQVEHLAPDNVSNGAAVVIDPKTGEILALVGSKDWYNTSFGKVNIVTATRPPGSSFKPIVYAAALEERAITPATALQDVPTTFPGDYKPLDYDRRFRGTVLVRRALANSLNIPSVEVLQKIGVPSALEMAHRLGITTLQDPSQYGLSLVLGTGDVQLLQMANAYGVFANHGLRNPPTSILQITDKTGKTIYTYKSHPQPVLEPDVAFLISSILSDNVTRAEEFGNTLTISRPAAVKTGTTEDWKDAWTIGYTPSVVVGVWVGNNDNRSMDRIAGSLGAAPIWRSLMEHFLAGTPVEQFTPPTDIVQLSVCRNNGFLARGGYHGTGKEFFLTGTGPTHYCSPPVASGSAVPLSVTPSQPPVQVNNPAAAPEIVSQVMGTVQ